MGTLGLIGLAKTQGYISAMRPYLEKALAAGIYYDTGLVNTVLKAFDE
jgi:predicted nucleic acid-binding protein